MTDYFYELNTMLNAETEIQTIHLMGMLHGIEIDASKQCQILITTESGIKLYENPSYFGKQFLFIRFPCINSKHESLTFENACFCIDESLFIKISGGFETVVSFKLRLNNG